MDIFYTRGKIRNALFTLAFGDGNLRRRVPEACAELMAAAFRTGFEEQFGKINQITKKVYQGDWKRVSDAEIKEIAVIIWRLNERIS